MTRKRRFCAECRLLEPAEGWTNGECPACAWRKEYVAPERKTRRRPAPTDAVRAAGRRAFIDNQQEKHVPGLCRKCGKVKPPEMFPPRCAGDPPWRPHGYRCKACVCASSKECIWRKRRPEFKAELEAMTVDELDWEVKALGRRMVMIREELKARGGER